MDITFHGAAREVTGSCHLVRVGDHRILRDCGLIQGKPTDEARNREPFPFDPARIAAWPGVSTRLDDAVARSSQAGNLKDRLATSRIGHCRR